MDDCLSRGEQESLRRNGTEEQPHAYAVVLRYLRARDVGNPAAGVRPSTHYENCIALEPIGASPEPAGTQACLPGNRKVLGLHWAGAR